MKWSRAKGMRGPSIQPFYTYALALISFMATVGTQGFRYMRVWTPLERHYLLAYLGSQVVGVVRDNGSYALLQVATRKGSRLALDSDVLPTVTESGKNSFALSEEALKHGALRLEFHRGHYNNAEMHAYIGNLIYQNQTLMDLVRPALWIGLVLFFAGMLPATYLDRKRFSAPRYGRKLRGPELMTVAQFNRKHRSRGIGFVNKLRAMLDQMLGLNKKLHVPLSKDNSHVSIMAKALAQEPPKMAAAAGTEGTPQPSDTRQEPAPLEQKPIQGPEFEHAVKPTARCFFE
ncbi:MAG: hypothetical protein WAN12_04600 [Candidatus Acidiferrum sp.]|jgi:hypothetical protein